MGTLLCQQCETGHVTVVDSLKDASDWKCSDCSFLLSHDEVRHLIEELEKEASSLPLNKRVYEKTLERFSRILHPNHHIMVDMEFTLIQLLGRQPSSKSNQFNEQDGSKSVENGSSKDEMMSEAHRKLALCKKVLDLIGVLTPGKVRMRGMFLSETYGIITYLARHAFNAGEITSDEYLSRLRSCSVFLEEAIEILSYEPEGTIEASRLKIAKDFRVYLGKIVKDLEEYDKLVKTEDKCTEDEKIRESEDIESKMEKQ